MCKCWFADNKVSIEHHERGKNHKENVERRINDIMKKGRKEHAVQQKMDNQMAKIEAAALKAMKKDIDAGVAPQGSEALLYAEAERLAKRKQEKSKPSTSANAAPSMAKRRDIGPSLIKTWIERQDTDGSLFYINMENGEKSQNPPASGFLSLADQARQEQMKEAGIDPDEFAACPEAASMPGTWHLVHETKFEPSNASVDLELPSGYADEQYVPPIVAPPVDEKTRFKLKQKSITSLAPGDGEEMSCAFKKRKVCSRNVRQRVDD